MELPHYGRAITRCNRPTGCCSGRRRNSHSCPQATSFDGRHWLHQPWRCCGSNVPPCHRFSDEVSGLMAEACGTVDSARAPASPQSCAGRPTPRGTCAASPRQGKLRVPGCCSGRRRNSHSCPMARHGFRLGPTPCRSHASAMPIGVGRHHQTNQSQTKDLTERIADALVSAMCPCIFGKSKKKTPLALVLLYISYSWVLPKKTRLSYCFILRTRGSY